MLVIGFVLLGGFSYQNLVVEMMPNIEFPVITVTTIYPGAGPSEVETQISTKIEDAVSTISGIDILESISRESVSFVIIRFELETDIDNAANDVKAKVDAILNDLPSGAEKPRVEKFEMGAFPVVSLALSSDRGVNEAYALADKTIRDRLVQIAGVATVEIIGGQQREILVAVDRAKLEHFGIPVTAVSAAITAENVNIPGGRITTAAEEYTVRTVGEFGSTGEIGNVRIELPSGGFISVKDIATIRDTHEEPRSSARFDGEASVQIDIVKRAEANTIEVADHIYTAVKSLGREIPGGFTLDYAHDGSLFIRDAVKDVQQNIMIGIALTAILLYLFLRNIRITLIAAVVMPAAIISTFLPMQAAGFTLNIISLMALGISVGILVTNAIVVIENIMRHRQMGDTPDVAAIRGTNEIALAVVASVATNVVVFVPVAFMRGIIGRFFLQFGITVVFATLFSLIMSLTLTPMLASVFLKRGRRSSEKNSSTADGDVPVSVSDRWIDRSMARLEAGYRGVLQWGLERKRNRWILVISTVVLLVFSLLLMAISGGEFMPRMDQGDVYLSVDLPIGTPLSVTKGVVQEIESILRENPAVSSVLSTIGGANQGVHEAQILVKLVDRGERDGSAYEIAGSLRPQMARIPGATISITDDSGPGGVGADLEIEVLGDESEPLKQSADAVLRLVAETPGLVDVESSWEEGAEEVVFIPARDEIARRGISTGMLAMLLRNAYEGDDRSVFRDAGEEYAIRVQFDNDDRHSVSQFETIRINIGSDRVPLTQLGHVVERRGEGEIQRRDRQKRITVTANIAQGTISEAVASIRAEIDQLDLPPGYRVKFAGMYEIQQESFTYIFQALVMAILLTYVVLAMILESFVHPITVMLTLPLGLVGASFGLFFGGQSINIMSLMAMVMLVGIVVNNAILLLDYIGVLRRRGLAMRNAVIDACPVKLRPIIMTNLAIAVGMIPQALGGAGSEIRVTMAVVTIGGVLVSAVFTLIIIPTLYEAFEGFVERLKGRGESQ